MIYVNFVWTPSISFMPLFSFFRAENKVSILLKDIEDIQESKRLADEKLKGLQTENSSLKSALSKATNEYDMFTIHEYLYRYLM